MADNTLNLDLHNRKQAWAIITAQLFPFLKCWLQDGRKLVLTCGPRKRTKPQNRRYWGRGVLAQIAEQAAPDGKLYSAKIWHEQFKRMFIGVIEMPDGGVVGMSSTELGTAEFSEFCTKVEAFAANELLVTFYDLEPE